MNTVSEYLAIIAARTEAENPKAPDDYTVDGLLYCGKCKTPKQCRPFANQSVVVFCACKCKEQGYDRLRAERKASERESARNQCFTGYDGVMKSDCLNTFDADDAEGTAASQAVRGYVDDPRSGWLMLCGKTGTGKSFYAACICNALIDRGCRCKFTSISEIADAVFAAEDKAAVYAELVRYDLIVIDDLGAERRTEYMKEITFRVIDSLLRAEMPVVITTNLTQREMTDQQDTDLQRVYSRICQKAIPVPVTGDDRRLKGMMNTARGRMQKLIEGGRDELCGYTEISE